MLGYITDSAAPNGLDRRDLPEPEPTPHQAVIEVGAYAINRGELSLLSQRAAGAIVTAHVSGPSRVEQVRALGADAVITQIGEDSGPFHLVVDGVGGSVLVDAIHRLAQGGLATAYGLASGERSQIAFFDFNNAQPGARLEGFRIYTTGEETFGEDLATLAGMVADGRLDPQIGVVRDWSGTVEALDALRSRQATGKVVLTRG